MGMPFGIFCGIFASGDGLSLLAAPQDDQKAEPDFFEHLLEPSDFIGPAHDNFLVDILGPGKIFRCLGQPFKGGKHFGDGHEYTQA